MDPWDVISVRKRSIKKIFKNSSLNSLCLVIITVAHPVESNGMDMVSG